MFIPAIIAMIPIAGLVNYLLRRITQGKKSQPFANAGSMVEICGINTHMLIQSEGEPLILVHGSQMNFLDWRYNIDFFSNHFQVYAFDMVGCGFSGKPDAPYTPEYFADFINKAMNHFSIEKAAFVAS